MTFIKHPGAPRVGLVATMTVFRYMLDESNTAVIQFTVVDTDTAAADVTVSLQTTLQTAVARLGNTNDYTLTISVSATFPIAAAVSRVGARLRWLAWPGVELGSQDWTCWRVHTASHILLGPD